MRPGGIPVGSVASPLRRLLAAVLDAGIALSGTGVLVATGVFLYRRSPGARRRLGSVKLPPSVSGLGGSPAGYALPAGWRQAIWVASAAEAVVGRNWRGPGERIVRIRRVDVHTGGPVTVRSAVIRFAAAEAWKRVNARFYAPPQRRAAQRLSAVAPALKDVQQEHRDDREAQQRAMMTIYRAHGVNPLASCLWPLPGMVVLSLPALWSPRRQTAYDWLAGTVTVSQK